MATLLEREVALEAVARELPTGKRRDERLAELVELRNLIKALKPRCVFSRGTHYAIDGKSCTLTAL